MTFAACKFLQFCIFFLLIPFYDYATKLFNQQFLIFSPSNSCGKTPTNLDLNILVSQDENLDFRVFMFPKQVSRNSTNSAANIWHHSKQIVLVIYRFIHINSREITLYPARLPEALFSTKQSIKWLADRKTTGISFPDTKLLLFHRSNQSPNPSESLAQPEIRYKQNFVNWQWSASRRLERS